jgi:tetratricopeptide (TPR) repeat protein
MTPDSPRRAWKATGVCILPAVLVFIAFGQTMRFGFVNYDDPEYVYSNPMVSKGISLAGVGWAFTHVVSWHWHPLTVIVLMLESSLFGMSPGSFHLVNVSIHAACAVFLFLMLLEMTGALWRSVFVAAVFAIHPLRAESVAWISECKDVLSGMFFMLTLWSYVRFARRPSAGRYAFILLWFALGLMSKPMLVTLPCVLLLLDYWPLGRLRTFSQFPGLLWEKAPLFALSVLSSLAAILALRSGRDPVSTYPANAPIAYVAYLGKFIYPIHLAVDYPIPDNGWPAWQLCGAILLLAALTAGAWLLRRKQPYLLIGWLWYIGMLVPVSGLMQTGDQAYADRYTYLPQIGLCIAVTWMAADWAGLQGRRRAILGGLAAVILGALLAAARVQAAYWRNSEILWRHTIALTPDSFLAHYNLGCALYDQGRVDEAIAECRESLRLNPNYADAHYNLGNALEHQGREAEAIAEYREALQLNPNYADACYNLGNALYAQGRVAEAISLYRDAVRIDPDYADAHDNLGAALDQQGRVDEAIAEFREAVRSKSDSADALNNLGNALDQQGREAEAIAAYRDAVRIDPTFVVAQVNLGETLFEQGLSREAISSLQKALGLQPASPDIEERLAWMLAAAPQPFLRDGPRAVELAMKACQASGGRDPDCLRTLAAAYAQAGDFSNAVKIAQDALQLAAAQPDRALANELPREIKLYQSGRPFEDPRWQGKQPPAEDQ